MERQTATKVQKAPDRVNHLSTQPGRSTVAAHPLVDLQHSIGSQAVNRLIRSPYIQTKLTVSTPGDPYEREADRVAETVMRMPDPVVGRVPLAVREDDDEETVATKLETEQGKQPDDKDEIAQPKPIRDIPPRRQTREDEDKENPPTEPVIKREEEEEEKENPLLARSVTTVPASTPAISPAVSANVHAMQGSGSQLPPSTRTFFESRFGTDFSHVRVHTDSRALETADSLQARAFTVGPNIAFGAGQYSPESSEGKRLLAHELTHVVQQTGSKVHRAPEPETVTEDERPKIDEDKNEAPDLMGAWYNVDIPFTDYYFDPSIEGIETAAGLAKDAVVDSASYAADQAVSAFDWVFEKIKGLISDGIDWLTRKYEAIKEFAVTAFDTINIGIDSLKGFITVPAELLTKAFENLDSDLLGTAWSMLKTGATLAWKGIKAIIDGVLESATGLWDTVTGYVTALFDRVEGIMDSWPFQQLPDFLQSSARALFAEIRDLWVKVRDFLTDLLKRLKEYTEEIVKSLETFVQNILDYAIETVISTVKRIRGAWDFIANVASDPIGFIRPHTDKLAAQLNAEALPKAMEFRDEKLTENFRREKSSEGKDTVIQLSPADAKSERSTAGWDEVVDGLYTAGSEAWNSLNIGQMLLDIVVNTFCPPATIRAIGKEFSELWHNDWANAVDGLYAPRTDGFWHFLHDLWSNFLVLLDFPLTLARRLIAVLMLFLGLLTTLAIIIGAIGGGVLGALEGGFFGFFPGAYEGAKLALELSAVAGKKLLVWYLKVEGITVVKSLLDLFTARQTKTEKKRDYMQIVASLFGMAVALIIVGLLSLLSALLGAVVQGIKGAGARAVKPVPPGEGVKPTEPVKPGEPVKPAEPVEPAKPKTPPEEPAKPAEEVKPPPKETEPVSAVEGKSNYFIVNDLRAAIKATKPKFLHDLKVNKSIWHWKLYVELPNGQIAVFCEINIRFRGSPDLNLHPKKATVEGVPGTVFLEGKGWTDHALRVMFETYEAKFGHPPKNLGGFIEADNLKYFQEAFAKHRNQNRELSNQQLGEMAIKEVSFGKQRVQRGYTHFLITILKWGEVKLADGSVQNVPTMVRIEATKTPYKFDRIPRLRPEDIEEGEGETGE